MVREIVPSTHQIDVPPRTGASERVSQFLGRHPWTLLLGLLPAVPAIFLGYGTDIDSSGVREAGRSLFRGEYAISRPPGAFVHEAATAILDRLGGPIATNLSSLLAGAVVLWTLASLLRRAGARHPELAALVLAGNPYFVVAASSLADHLWAIAFLLTGIDAFQRRRPGLAGILWALAISCRMATGVLVFVYLGAELLLDRRSKRPVCIAGLVAGLLGALAFVPAWLSVGRSADFLENSFGTPSLLNLVGRSAVKQQLFFGLPFLVLVVVAAPRIFGGLRERLRRPLVLFAVVGAVASELIYLRLPWKFAHLLPLLVCVVIIIGTSKTLKPAWLIALAVAQLSWGLVAVRIVAPDVPNAATTARIDLAIVYGPLVTDVRCRVDQRLSGPLDDTSFDRAAAAYECSNRWAFDDDPTAPIGAGP